MRKVRLDILLSQKGFSESRNQAQRLVMAGEVRVDGNMALKASQLVSEDATLEIKKKPPFVSRGGEKLIAALQAFNLTDLNGWICVDVGASTGGFTDCLLQHGAAKVYAVDVGYGQLHYGLRSDPRIVVMERTNARNINGFPEFIHLVTVDASFISLKILLPVIKSWFEHDQGIVVALIKPQFEAGRVETARGEGVIRDEKIHRQVLLDVLKSSSHDGFTPFGLIRSPLLGPKGNAEFLAYLRMTGEGTDPILLVDQLFIDDR